VRCAFSPVSILTINIGLVLIIYSFITIMFNKTVLVSLVLAAIGASAAPVNVETRSPETWGEWGSAIGNYWAHRYASPDDVPGLPHYKRSPEPETWAEWGKNVGEYWAHRYATPDDVPGLRHYKREPEPLSIGDLASDFGNLFGDYYVSRVHGIS
jgi:hypothetical protein